MPEPLIDTENLKNTVVTDKNNLFPVFFKLHQLRLLIVGGGNVGLEKLQAVLDNSPQATITLVGKTILPAIVDLGKSYPKLQLHNRAFVEGDLAEVDLVFIAVNDLELSSELSLLAKNHGKLVNVADKPDLCDFYLGSIYQKGNLKIAISTNGKSPTIAKRIKEQLEDAIPDEMEDVLQNMQSIRNSLKGNFTEKVKKLNEVTKVLATKPLTKEEINKQAGRKWQKVVIYCLFALVFMLLGHGLLSLVSMTEIVEGIRSLPKQVDMQAFTIMLITGFLAQMVDGSLGMGYGTIATTVLLSYGVSPAIVSSRVHTARVFSAGVSGYSHHRFGNINKKLFKAIVIPGVIGAIIGATLAYFAQSYSSWVRLPLSIYTVYLGYYIIRKAFKRSFKRQKIKRAGWLASAGGFMDAFAGGGWGTLVTSTLISKRRSPRFVIGSVCLAEFFVVFTSSITFFVLLKSIPLSDVAGLIVGGLVAAPIAARLAGKLPLKTMFIVVGSFVILTSLNTLYKVIVSLL